MVDAVHANELGQVRIRENASKHTIWAVLSVLRPMTNATEAADDLSLWTYEGKARKRDTTRQ